MNNLLIIINGQGGVGKDSLIKSLKNIEVINISSIDSIKEIATSIGYMGEKDPKSRKFLSDLKALLNEYNDYPYKQLISKVREANKAMDNGVIFIHIREPKEIERFKKDFENEEIYTMIVLRETGIIYNNKSDEEVFDYNYDITFMNEKDIEYTSMYFNDLILSLKEYLND